MNCPNCGEYIELSRMTIDMDAEEDGVEVSFTCRGCNVDQYAVLKPENFLPVE